MRNLNKLLSAILFTGILFSTVLVSSCESWMSNDEFMTEIETEVHDANASEINVYVRFANIKMGTTEPQGNTTMKVDVTSKVSSVANDDYGFVRWAAFSTADFPTDKQHSNLTYVSEDAYNAAFKEKELPDTVVHFSDPTNPVTDVKIYEQRSDVFLIPIVALRPSYVQSIPSDSDKNVVTNTSIRILFSKAINEATLHDSEGNLNYSIMASNFTMTDDDSEMEAQDITDLFVYSLSTTGKMLTLSLVKNDDGTIKQLLESRKRITVTLYDGICDTFGYSMSNNFKFSFVTGTGSDSLAPWIEVLVGGKDIVSLGSYDSLYSSYNKGEATDAAKSAKRDINDEMYTDTLVAQRVTNKLYLYIKAQDVVGSGSFQIDPQKNYDEENVAYIGIRASLFVDKDGDAASADLTIPRKNMMYVPGQVDSSVSTDKTYTEIIPLDTEGKPKYSSGEIYCYDLSSLPDGLIKIDVWGIDMVGNSGIDDKASAFYRSAEHDNSYKSIFVVKDTTPVNSASVKENKLVKSKSADAPYYWYNSETLGTMKLFDTAQSKIVDNGHSKLRALDNNLFWTFAVGTDNTAPAASSNKWVRIHDETTGASVEYSLNNAQASEDGPVDITLFLKDDMGNISDPVVLDSIMYDNTKPTVTLKDGEGDFINEDGDNIQNNTSVEALAQILKVDFVEPNENGNGSGIRRMEIHVKKGTTEVAEPINSNFKVLYVPSTVADPTPKTTAAEGLREIAISTTDSWSATDNHKVVFDVNDSNRISSGTFFISGLTIGNQDGPWTIEVNLYDSAMNPAASVATTTMKRDTTNPDIKKIEVAQAQARTVYNDATEAKTWWMPSSTFTGEGSEKTSRVTFNINVQEGGSGIKVIKLGSDVEFTDSTVLKDSAGTELVKDTDYTLDLSANTITLLDPYHPKFISDSANTNSYTSFTLENIKLKNKDNAAGNAVSVEVHDFVENTNSLATLTYSDTTTGTIIYVDSEKPVITTLKIEDSAHNAETNPDNKGYSGSVSSSTVYTDSQDVTLLLTLESEDEKHGSGVKKVILSDNGNAEFTASTEIFVDDIKLTSGYSIAADKKSVSFTKVFTAANLLKFTNVHLISSAQGVQTVNAELTDFVGLGSDVKTSSEIIYDNVVPEINRIEWIAPAGVAKGQAKDNTVTDQTLKVDFTEATAGAKVIKFDINYENQTESYSNPFDLGDLTLKYGSETLTNITDYSIDGKYIILKEPKITGSFNFDNLKLDADKHEGQYTINVSLLDAAENKTPAANASKTIFIDTTAPLVKVVKIADAIPRTVYGDSTNTKTWWMPYSKFANGSLSNVTIQITVDEAGSGLKVLKLSEDIEFTANTILKDSTGTALVKDTDYTLDLTEHTITLLNYEAPKLKGTTAVAPATENTPVTFTLENVKLNNINTSNGNKIAFSVEDFVRNPGSNLDGTDYKVFYPDNTNGTLVFADDTKPAIATLNLADAAHNTVTNPDNKSYIPSKYTDSQNITLTLKLEKESTNFGSGVEKVHLTDNAEFTTTGTNKTEIWVGETKLGTSAYQFVDSKTVKFTQVFTEDQILKFTNVHILATTDGNQLVKAKLTDLVGIQADVKTSDNSLILDRESPVISKVEWVADNSTVTAGTSNTNEIENQKIDVKFTETTAGINVIKFDIKHESDAADAESYTNPFDLSDLTITYGETTPLKTLVKDDDYEVDGRYIILKKDTFKGNTFSFHGIKLRDSAEEGVYTVTVTLQDAAENIGTSSDTIAIDTVKPVIDGNLRIHDLIHSVELTTSTTDNPEKYWLPKEMVDSSTSPTGSDYKKPDSIPLYLTIKEKSSGVKVIQFSSDVLLNSNTKLYLVADDATTETDSTKHTEIPSSVYTVNASARTITINTKDSAMQYFAKKNAAGEEVPFTIFIDNIGFNNQDALNKASSNSITVTVSDVAKNVSDEATTAETYIYSDSKVPEAPSSFKVIDRDHDATKGTILASDHYTNESIVDLTFNLSSSEQYGSGYHKFTLQGAKFKSVNDVSNASDATILNVKNGDTQIPFVYEIEDNGYTLVLKKSGAASDIHAVVKQAVNVEIKNVHLDNPSEQGYKEVKITAKDLTGWASGTVSYYTYLDTQKPVLYRIFAANYNDSNVPYYVPSVNVYPHAYQEDAVGIPVDFGTAASQKNVPTFYTATTYNSNYYQFSGQVSSTSEATSSTPTTNFTHGAVLGFHATDNIKLGGYVRSKTFLHYVQDDTFAKTTASQILDVSEGTSVSSTYRLNPARDINGANGITSGNNATGPNSATNESLWFGIPTGKYSAVIVDEAGNCSDVFHFAVVQDTTKPDKDIQNRVLLERPDESYNIYRNTTVTTDTTTSYKAYDSTSSSAIKTKKYVTKQAEKKYKIVLNLGNTYSNSTLISKLNGTSSGTVSEYSELKATKNSAPIEYYAISTWYGSWPTTSSPTNSYIPVVPYNTKFPSGQAQTASSNHNSLALMACNYFGGDSSFESRWRRVDDAKNPWVKYEKNSSGFIDPKNGIKSSIDSNNNIIIEVPNDRSTAPISVFLRDGCGNMNFIVLGLETSGGLETAVSITLDNKLAWKTTDSGAVENGHVKVPFILQAPYSYYSTSSDSDAILWGSDYIHFGYQSGNIESGAVAAGHNGDHEKFGFIKDIVKKSTYYNPNITSGSNTNVTKFKFGFAMHFWEPGKSNTSLTREDITFPISQKSELATQAQINAGEYSVRGLMYCTTENKELSYEKIIECYNEEKARDITEKTGQVTDWTYVRISDNSTDDEALIFLDYPCPNYERLGWDITNSKGEPEPYYIWYIIEDRVGNYELAKVVNSQVPDTQSSKLTAVHSDSSGIYDRWLYDGTGPKLTIRNTNTEPNTIPSSQTAVNSLVATNNGYVPYYSGSNLVYVRVTDGESFRNTSLKNETTGYGTTHKVEEATNERINEPFMDLEVSEITGVRAFAWSNDSTPPDRSYTDMNISNNRNTHGDNGWYAGYKATSQYADIGCNFYYGGTSNDINSGNNTNSYFSFTNSNSSYKGVYSGTKVNTIIPKAKLSESTSKQLWLHVMDWTGNVSSYRMGSSLLFKNDITGPSYSGNSNTDTTSVDEEYYVTSQLKVVIAGNAQGSSTNSKEMHVHFPTSYFSDNGAGYAGIILAVDGVLSKDRTVAKILKENFNGISNDPYMVIPYSEYSKWPKNSTGKTADDEDYIVKFYSFDNVGNSYRDGTACFTGAYDIDPPSISSVSFVTESGKGTEFIHTSTEDISDTNANYGKYTNFTAKTDTTKLSSTSELEADLAAGKVQEIWVNKTGTSSFHINLTSNFDDVDDVIINKWTGSAWEKLSSWKANNSSWNHASGDVTYRPKSFTLLNDFTASGTYYQIVTKDLAGNCCYQYFKLYLDNTGPALTARTTSPTPSETSTNESNPIVELGKGSVNKVTVSGTDTYYYTAGTTDAEKLKIHFAITDGSIPLSKQKLFYGFGFASKTAAENATTGWTEVTPVEGGTDITASFSDGDIQKIYLKDVLGNVSELTPGTTAFGGYDYTYTHKNDSNEDVSTTVTIPKLTKYTEDTPAAPKINASKNGDVNIVSEISTYGYGYDDDWEKHYNPDYYESGYNVSYEPEWSKLYTNISATTNGVKTVIISKDDETARQKLRITFPTTNNKIIGYLCLDDNETPESTVGKYSFNNTLTNVFTTDLPLNGENVYTEKTLKYYAVDVVGNISSALTILYSYDNPHMVQHIKLIEDPVTSTEIPDDVKTAMQSDNLDFARFYTDNAKGPKDKKNLMYFNDGYIVVRCSTAIKAGEGYSETPTWVGLYDVWYESNRQKSEIRGESNSQYFKLYTSSEEDKVGGRYYCYIAFKPGLTKNNTWTVSTFNNNDNYDGSVLNFKIRGTAVTSDYAPLSNNETTKDYGWKMDTQAPTINDFYSKTVDGVNVLYNYVIKDKNGNEYSVQEKGEYQSGNIKTNSKVYDNKTKENNPTNLYSSGSKLYCYINNKLNGSLKATTCIVDNCTDWRKMKYQIVSTTEHNAVKPAYNDPNWKDMTPNSGNYIYELPDVATPHGYLALFLMDGLGNVTKPFYIGKNNDTKVQYWLLDGLLSDDTTITAPSSGWTPTAEDYTFDVNPPEGSIIKSVKASVAGTETQVAGVEFNGYTKGQPTLDGNKGWVNLSGIKVKLNKINCDSWNPKSVTITLNYVDQNNPGISKTVENFVPAKELEANDISINTSNDYEKAKWVSGTSTYDLPMKLKNGAGIGNIENIEVSSGPEGVEVDSWGINETTNIPYVRIKGVPGKDWTEKKITLTVNDNIEKTNVFKIPKLEESDFTISKNNESDKSDGSKLVKFNWIINTSIVPELSAPSIAFSWGNFAGLGVNSELNCQTIDAEFFPDWKDGDNEGKKINLSINGLLYENVYTVRDIAADDISIVVNDNEPEEFIEPGEYTLKISLPGLNATNANGGIIGPVIDSTKLSIAGAEPLDDPWNAEESTYKVKVEKGWNEKTVKLTIHGLEKSIFKVHPKVLEDGHVTIDAKNWTDESTPYEFSIALSENASMNNVSDVLLDSSCQALASLTWTSGQSTFTIGLPEGKTSWEELKTWEEQAIKVVVKNTEGTSLSAIPVLTIPPKSLSADDIIVGVAETTPDWDGSSETYEVTIALNDGIPDSALTGVTAEYATAEFNADKSKIILSGFADNQDWTEKTVTFNINGDNNLTYTALKIPAKKITADNVSVTKKEGASQYDCNIHVELKDVSSDVTITKIEAIDSTQVKVGEEHNWEAGWWTITPGDSAQDNKIPTGDVIKIVTTNGSVKVTLFADVVVSPTANIRGIGSALSDLLKDLVSGNDADNSGDTRIKKSRTASIIVNEPVSVVARDIADVLAEQEAASRKQAKKAAKLAKKNAKVAKKTAKKTAKQNEIAPVSEVIPETSEVIQNVAEKVVETETVNAGTVAAKRNEISATAQTGIELESEVILDSPATEDGVAAKNRKKALWTLMCALTAALVTAVAVIYTKKQHKA